MARSMEIFLEFILELADLLGFPRFTVCLLLGLGIAGLMAWLGPNTRPWRAVEGTVFVACLGFGAAWEVRSRS